MRELGEGQTVIGCDRPGCPDCIAREFVRRLKRAGVTFAGSAGDITFGATLEHWPGSGYAVEDDLLTGVRRGSFSPAS